MPYSAFQLPTKTIIRTVDAIYATISRLTSLLLIIGDPEYKRLLTTSNVLMFDCTNGSSNIALNTLNDVDVFTYTIRWTLLQAYSAIAMLRPHFMEYRIFRTEKRALKLHPVVMLSFSHIL